MYKFTLYAKKINNSFANSFIGAHSICTPLPSREQEKHTISLEEDCRTRMQVRNVCLSSRCSHCTYLMLLSSMFVLWFLWFTLCTWVVQCLQIDQEMFSEFRSFEDSVIGWENCVTGDASKISVK